MDDLIIDNIRSYTWMDLTFQEKRMERIYLIYRTKNDYGGNKMEEDISNLLILLKLLGLTADVLSRN